MFQNYAHISRRLPVPLVTVRGKAVIELGCGLGVPSCSAVLVGAAEVSLFLSQETFIGTLALIVLLLPRCFALIMMVRWPRLLRLQQSLTLYLLRVGAHSSRMGR